MKDYVLCTLSVIVCMIAFYVFIWCTVVYV